MKGIFLCGPVLLPLLCGAGLYLLPLRSQHTRERVSFAAVCATSLWILALLVSHPADRVELLRIAEDLPLALRCDGLGMVFLALIAFLWPLADAYAFEYMADEEHRASFFAFYTMSYGVTAGVALSANLITMYLFYELLTLVTIPLVAHERNKRSMAAARKYMIYSICGAAMAFVGIVMLIQRTGCADFTFGGSFGAAEKTDNVVLAAYMLTFAGFGVKAAVFPFHGWLPSAGVAPTPVTALLHAVAVVKSGVFACIRSTFYAFGAEALAGTWAQKAVLVMAAFTIIYGSAMAYREQHWKRRLAYSTVSNLSYILFGMALMTADGLTAGLSHMLFHGIMKITLFFCAGTVLCKTGRAYVDETEGLGRKMPLTFAVYAVASLALTGAPLLPGFVSKMNLLNAAAALGSGVAVFGVVALIISALLTAAYLLPMSVRAFLPHEGFSGEFTAKDRDPSYRMLIPFAVLTAAMLYFGFRSGPLMNLLDRLISGGM